MEDKFKAFKKFCQESFGEVNAEDISVSNYNDDVFEYDGMEFLVLTDAEADERQDDALENYIDECILPEIPETYRFYFDSEAWKCDARRDGRGHVLATYDGNENEVNLNGEYFYIYQLD